MKKKITSPIIVFLILISLFANVSIACDEGDGWKDCSGNQVRENWDNMPHTTEYFGKLDPPEPAKFNDLPAEEQTKYFSTPANIDKCLECAHRYYGNPGNIGKNPATDDKYYSNSEHIGKNPATDNKYYSNPKNVGKSKDTDKKYFGNPDNIGENPKSEDLYFPTIDLGEHVGASNRYLQRKFGNNQVTFNVIAGMRFSDNPSTLIKGQSKLILDVGPEKEGKIPIGADSVSFDEINNEFVFGPRNVAVHGDNIVLNDDGSFTFPGGGSIKDPGTVAQVQLEEGDVVEFTQNGLIVNGRAIGGWNDALGNENTFINFNGRLVITDGVVSGEDARVDYQDREIQGKFLASLVNGRLMHVALLESDNPERQSSYKDSFGAFKGTGNIEFYDNGNWKSAIGEGELEYGKYVKDDKGDRQHLFSGDFEANFNDDGSVNDARLFSRESSYKDKVNNLFVASLDPSKGNEKMRSLFSDVDFQPKHLVFGDAPNKEEMIRLGRQSESEGETLVYIGQRGGEPEISSYGRDLFLEIGEETIYSLKDRTFSNTYLDGDYAYTSLDNDGKPSDKEIFAVKGKKITDGDLAADGLVKGESELISYISNENGRITLDIDKDSLSLLAEMEKDPNRFALIGSNSMMELGDKQAYLGIGTDFGMRYETREGDVVNLLGPKDTQLYLGEDMEELMAASVLMSTGKKEESYKQLEKVMNEHPDEKQGHQARLILATSLVNDAMEAIRAGNMDEASGLLDEARNIYSGGWVPSLKGGFAGSSAQDQDYLSAAYIGLAEIERVALGQSSRDGTINPQLMKTMQEATIKRINEYYQKAIDNQQNPEVASQIRLTYAQHLIESGDIKGASEQYRQELKTNPGTESSEFARKQLGIMSAGTHISVMAEALKQEIIQLHMAEKAHTLITADEQLRRSGINGLYTPEEIEAGVNNDLETAKRMAGIMYRSANPVQWMRDAKSSAYAAGLEGIEKQKINEQSYLLQAVMGKIQSGEAASIRGSLSQIQNEKYIYKENLDGSAEVYRLVQQGDKWFSAGLDAAEEDKIPRLIVNNPEEVYNQGFKIVSSESAERLTNNNVMSLILRQEDLTDEFGIIDISKENTIKLELAHEYRQRGMYESARKLLSEIPTDTSSRISGIVVTARQELEDSQGIGWFDVGDEFKAGVPDMLASMTNPLMWVGYGAASNVVGFGLKSIGATALQTGTKSALSSVGTFFGESVSGRVAGFIAETAAEELVLEPGASLAGYGVGFALSGGNIGATQATSTAFETFAIALTGGPDAMDAAQYNAKRTALKTALDGADIRVSGEMFEFQGKRGQILDYDGKISTSDLGTDGMKVTDLGEGIFRLEGKGATFLLRPNGLELDVQDHSIISAMDYRNSVVSEAEAKAKFDEAKDSIYSNERLTRVMNGRAAYKVEDVPPVEDKNYMGWWKGQTTGETEAFVKSHAVPLKNTHDNLEKLTINLRKDLNKKGIVDSDGFFIDGRTGKRLKDAYGKDVSIVSARKDEFGNLITKDAYKTEEKIYRDLMASEDAWKAGKKGDFPQGTTIDEARKMVFNAKPEVPFALRDIAGTRVTVFSVEEQMEMAKTIEKGYGGAIIKKKDFTDFERQGSGYYSIHYIVAVEGKPVEIQLRTHLQTKWDGWNHDSIYKGYLKNDPVVMAYAKQVGEKIHDFELGVCPPPCELPTAPASILGSELDIWGQVCCDIN